MGSGGVCQDEDFLFNLMVEDESIITGEDHSCAEMQLVLRDMKNLVFNQAEMEKMGDHLLPLCTLLPGVNLAGCSSKGVLKNVQEIQECLGISCKGRSIQCLTYCH